MLDKLHLIVSIVATIIVTAISIYQDVSLHNMAVRLIVVIVAFYFVGLAAKTFLKRYVFVLPPEDFDFTDLEENGEVEETETMFEDINGEQPRPTRSKYD